MRRTGQCGRTILPTSRLGATIRHPADRPIVWQILTFLLPMGMVLGRWREVIPAAVVWLVLASAAGLISSIKLHEPEFLADYAWLTFGRIRTLHLNSVAYGWAPMAAFGIAIWTLPRLLKTELMGGRFAILGAMLWNAALIAGLGSIAAGFNDGLEWLEIPWQIDILFVIGGALIGLRRRCGGWWSTRRSTAGSPRPSMPTAVIPWFGGQSSASVGRARWHAGGSLTFCTRISTSA